MEVFYVHLIKKKKKSRFRLWEIHVLLVFQCNFFRLNYFLFVWFLNNLVLFSKWMFSVTDRMSNTWYNNSATALMQQCAHTHTLLWVIIHGNAAPVTVIFLQAAFFWPSLTPVFILENGASLLSATLDSKGSTSSLKNFGFFLRFLFNVWLQLAGLLKHDYLRGDTLRTIGFSLCILSRPAESYAGMIHFQSFH